MFNLARKSTGSGGGPKTNLMRNVCEREKERTSICEAVRNKRRETAAGSNIKRYE